VRARRDCRNMARRTVRDARDRVDDALEDFVERDPLIVVIADVD